LKIKIPIRDILKNTDAVLLKGNKNFIIDSIGSPQKNYPHSIVLISSASLLSKSNKFHTKTCITSKKLYAKAQNFENILVSEDPYLSFAYLLQYIKNLEKGNNNLTIKSVNNYSLGRNCKIGNNVIFGNNCVIEDNVQIGDNTEFEHNVVVHKNTIIGNNCSIMSGAIIGSQGFGFVPKDDSWVPIYHIGNVLIGDNVYIGANTCIDKATIDSTIIGNNVIVDNSVHIAHNVSIGANTAIAAKAGIAGSTTIGKNCKIGGMSGIFGHLNITDNVTITPKSNVYRDIKTPGTYSSLFPLMNHFLWKKVSILLSKLDKMYHLLKK